MLAETPKWIVLPLLAASLYTLVGGVIPGPVDELLVDIIGLGISTYGATRQLRSGSELQEDSDTVEGD
jgi:hypothetical protein